MDVATSTVGLIFKADQVSPDKKPTNNEQEATDALEQAYRRSGGVLSEAETSRITEAFQKFRVYDLRKLLQENELSVRGNK